MRVSALAAMYVRLVCDGLFVHMGGYSHADLVFSALPFEPASIPVWKEELKDYARVHDGLYPSRVQVGVFRYGLGTDYDEAAGGMGVSALYGLPASTRPEDLLRDKVALLIDCPKDLSLEVYHKGSYCALVGSGAKELSSWMNWDACITLSGSYERIDMLGEAVGGADYVISKDGVMEDGLEELRALQGIPVFSWTKDPSVLHAVAAYFRKGGTT